MVKCLNVGGSDLKSLIAGNKKYIITVFSGRLCGECDEGYGVTMDLLSCSNVKCALGLSLFILLCEYHNVAKCCLHTEKSVKWIERWLL